MDKCPTVELGVQYPPKRKEKENIEHLILLKVSKEQGRYVSPQKSKNRMTFTIVITIITIHHSFATHAHLDWTY